MHPDLLQVRAPALNFYVLRDASGLYLLDAGFIGGRFLLQRALRRRGWDREPIRGIIVTHGHLDHIFNVAKIAREAGAWIAAPRLDAEHYSGHPQYRGWARVTGFLESMGRPVLSFAPFVPDRWLDEGDLIEVWHGLRAVHLPGHTPGHMGFYCESLRLMFSADLFASYRGRAQFPPDIFNSVPEQVPQSAGKALTFDLAGIIPNHCDLAGPEAHLERLRRLQRDSGRALALTSNMSDSVSLEGPIELIDGELVLQIPLAVGGDKLAPFARGISEVDGEHLTIVIKPWLAEKLNIGAGSLVHVDNCDGKLTITRSAKNDEPKGAQDP